MLGLILLLHFGGFEILALAWRALGIEAEAIMRSPISAHSLSEFWGKRWNLGFRLLSHRFVFQPVQRLVGPSAAALLVFFFSGLIHEPVISVPARGGYGLPTAYFLLQGLGASLERSKVGRILGLGAGLSGWASR
jgi:D-alanyl-lipoteichoic acid acyltransferase DltB (MBOAT superfamily)